MVFPSVNDGPPAYSSCQRILSFPFAIQPIPIQNGTRLLPNDNPNRSLREGLVQIELPPFCVLPSPIDAVRVPPPPPSFSFVSHLLACRIHVHNPHLAFSSKSGCLIIPVRRLLPIPPSVLIGKTRLFSLPS